LWVTDGARVIVTTHRPDPFELSLSIASTGSAELSGPLPVRTVIDEGLTFSDDDRFLWCLGPQQTCSPPFQGYAYFGVRADPGDGVHYGWVSVYCQDLGFGNVSLRISAGALQTCAGVPVLAGVSDATLPSCDSADFNCDGDTGTDSDIDAFFSCLAGACPAPPCPNDADFDNDGDVGTDSDIEAFFSVLAGRPCAPP
jgi:hypothetical protein